MRPWILSVLVFVALSIIACDPSAPRPGPLQDFATACDRPNEGQTIAVEGYLRLPDSLMGSDSVDLLLYPNPEFTGEPVGVTMLFGDGPNRAENITSSYHDSDLKVHLADGRLVPFGTRVRVSGRMSYPVVPRDFACALENPYVEVAK